MDLELTAELTQGFNFSSATTPSDVLNVCSLHGFCKRYKEEGSSSSSSLALHTVGRNPQSMAKNETRPVTGHVLPSGHVETY